MLCRKELQMGDTGLEPVTSCMSSRHTSNVTPENKEVKTNEIRACTTACTGEPENEQNNTLKGVVETGPAEPISSDKKPAEGDLQELVGRLAKLTPEQRKTVLTLLDQEAK